MTQDRAERMKRRKLNQAELDREIAELVKKYGPKQIGQYEENGAMVRVYEAR